MAAPTGVAGTAQYGGGGGGGRSTGFDVGAGDQNGGAGGSGIVIIRYLKSSVASQKSGGTQTSDATYYYNTFTGTGTFTV
jgi:hypothetical protein